MRTGAYPLLRFSDRNSTSSKARTSEFNPLQQHRIQGTNQTRLCVEHPVNNEFLEPELDNWLANPKPSGFIMNRPIPLTMVLLVSIILLVLIYPKAELYLKPVGDCGDITTRPELAPNDRIALTHNTFCRMTGTVADLRVFSSGADHLDGPEFEKGVLPPQSAFDGVKYFSKLTGDKVFVILNAADDRVYKYRRKHAGDALFGFNIDHVGRIVDPSQTSGSLKKIGHYMRRQFIVPANRADPPLRHDRYTK